MSRQTDGGKPWWLTCLVLFFGGLLVVILVLLGNWQLERRTWKLDLVERVNSRAFAPPRPPPRGGITANKHEYMRIEVVGTFDHARTVIVKAVTDLGPGYWVMTPLRTGHEFVWVNRGFVPSKKRRMEDWSKPDQEVRIVGLLRLSEPKGTLLERNDPENNRWFSRDIDAISKLVGLTGTTNFFLDQQNSFHPADWPRSGLTVVKYRNPHLVYALTWYAMALLLAGALYWTHKPEFKFRAW